MSPNESNPFDPFNLRRFEEAQEGAFEQARKELSQGRKTGHWMWYIFPQFAGLGSSDLSQRFAIYSIEEAQAYLVHPLLGARLNEVCHIVNQIKGRTMHQVFGYPDDLKLKSSMTLFAQAAPKDLVFANIIKDKFAGEYDQRTLDLLDRSARP